MGTLQTMTPLTSTSPATVTIWTDPARAPLALSVLQMLGSSVQPLGVGGPRHATIDELAQQLNCHRDDDLRKLLVDKPASFVLLASSSGASVDDVVMASSQGSLVLMIDPIAASLDALQSTKTRSTTKRSSGEEPITTESDAVALPWPESQVLLLPSFFNCVGWSSAADPAQALGQVRSLSFTSLGRPGEGSLLARLQDAWEVIVSLAGLPETIDATGSTTTDLRKLTGHITAMARFADGSGATLHASDQAASCQRELRAVGTQGQVRVAQQDYDLYASTGELLDHKPADARENVMSFEQLVAAQWRAVLSHRPQPRPERAKLSVHALACAMATALSGQTGQPESPGQLLQIHGQG